MAVLNQWMNPLIDPLFNDVIGKQGLIGGRRSLGTHR